VTHGAAILFAVAFEHRRIKVEGAPFSARPSAHRHNEYKNLCVSPMPNFMKKLRIVSSHGKRVTPIMACRTALLPKTGLLFI
jgi:hypothetical protein